MMKNVVRICIVLIILAMTSCSASTEIKNQDEILTIAIENIKAPLNATDNRFSIYENFLTKVNEYISNPTEENIKNAKKLCEESIKNIEAIPIPELTLSDSDLKSMAEIGLNTADYKIPFEYDSYYRLDNIATIKFISYYLDFINDSLETSEYLKFLLDFYINIQAIDRKTEYMCFNELFCKFSGDVIDEFKDSFLVNLTVVSQDGLPWETETTVIISKINKLMNDADLQVEKYAEMLGEKYLLLLEDQMKYKNALIASGYTSTEADSILSDIVK